MTKQRQPKVPAGVFKPKGSSKHRPGWTAHEYHFRLTINGKRQSFEGYSDLAMTLRLRQELRRQIERHQEGEAIKRDECSPLLLRHLARLGLIEAIERRSLDELVIAYQQDLTDDDNGDDHITRSVARIKKIVAACGFKLPRDIEAAPIKHYLAERRRKEKETFGPATSNHYLTAVKSFVSYLRRRKLLFDDPLTDLEKLSVGDPRRQRRVLADDEITKLLKATPTNATKHKVRPADRAMVYQVALATGLRAEELAEVTPADFLFGDHPAITVRASVSKNGKLETLPLDAGIAAILRPYLVGKPVGLPIFPGRWYRRANEMLKSDLAAAKLKAEDDQGRVADFHALRHTCITRWVMRGLHPKVVQILARHSTMELTMAYYTHLDRQQLQSLLAQTVHFSI